MTTTVYLEATTTSTIYKQKNNVFRFQLIHVVQGDKNGTRKPPSLEITLPIRATLLNSDDDYY